MRRKPILIAGDFGRALLLASIPIAYWLGRADDLAALRRRLPRRGPDGLLRRRVPVVPPLARRARPDRRRQLEARDQPLGGTAHRARPRRHPRRGREGAGRSARRRGQLRSSRRSSSSGSASRGAGADTSRAAGRPRDEAGGEGGPALGRSATATCAGMPAARRRSTSSGASSSPSTSSSPCASSTSRPGVIGLVFSVSSIGSLVARTAREPPLAPLRGRPDDHRRRLAVRPSLLLLALAPTSNARSRS